MPAARSVSADCAAATLVHAQKMHHGMRNTYIEVCAIGTFRPIHASDRLTLGDRIEAIPICALWK